MANNDPQDQEPEEKYNSDDNHLVPKNKLDATNRYHRVFLFVRNASK